MSGAVALYSNYLLQDQANSSHASFEPAGDTHCHSQYPLHCLSCPQHVSSMSMLCQSTGPSFRLPVQLCCRSINWSPKSSPQCLWPRPSSLVTKPPSQAIQSHRAFNLCPSGPPASLSSTSDLVLLSIKPSLVHLPSHVIAA